MERLSRRDVLILAAALVANPILASCQGVARTDIKRRTPIYDQPLQEGDRILGKERIYLDIPNNPDSGIYELEVKAGVLIVDEFRTEISRINPMIVTNFNMVPGQPSRVMVAISNRESTHGFVENSGEFRTVVEASQANLLTARWSNWTFTEVRWNGVPQEIKVLVPHN